MAAAASNKELEYMKQPLLLDTGKASGTGEPAPSAPAADVAITVLAQPVPAVAQAPVPALRGRVRQSTGECPGGCCCKWITIGSTIGAVVWFIGFWATHSLTWS